MTGATVAKLLREINTLLFAGVIAIVALIGVKSFGGDGLVSGDGRLGSWLPLPAWIFFAVYLLVIIWIGGDRLLIHLRLVPPRADRHRQRELVGLVGFLAAGTGMAFTLYAISAAMGAQSNFGLGSRESLEAVTASLGIAMRTSFVGYVLAMIAQGVAFCINADGQAQEIEASSSEDAKQVSVDGDEYARQTFAEPKTAS